MSPTREEKEFTNYIVDLMQSVGSVSAKPMFGGYGLFLSGVMFGVIVDNALYLKADKETENDFLSLGLEPFTYMRKGKEISMSYYQAPEDTLEDGEVMHEWAAKAYTTALRTSSKKQKE